MSEIRVYMRHIRQGNFCAHGMRDWATAHGVDALEFIRHGIPAETLEATGDHFAVTVAKLAREEAARG